jgi:hypothetical protein
MDKLILMSILIGLLTIPTRAARDTNSLQGLRRALKTLLIFEVVYALMLRFLWGRFG